MTKIAILDNLAVAQSMAAALESHEAIESASPVASLNELKEAVAQDAPSVLVVGIATHNVAARLEVCEWPLVKSGKSRVLFLSSDDQPSLLQVARRRGAAGFLLKSQPLVLVASAIATIAGGGDVFDSEVRSAPPDVGRPSDRELQVLEHVSRGLTNAAIAHALGISARTVESHLRRMFVRYRMSSRAQLLILAVHEGWLRGWLS